MCVIGVACMVWHWCGIAVNSEVWHWWGMAREDLHFRLRIPEELKAEIEEAAAENHRSMTAEIIARLTASLTPAWPPVRLPPDLEARVYDLPMTTTLALEQEIQEFAHRRVINAIEHRESSRQNLLRSFREMISDAPEEEQQELAQEMRDLLRRAGISETDFIVRDEGK
jgi:hypothetical protein